MSGLIERSNMFALLVLSRSIVYLRRVSSGFVLFRPLFGCRLSQDVIVRLDDETERRVSDHHHDFVVILISRSVVRDLSEKRSLASGVFLSGSVFR